MLNDILFFFSVGFQILLILFGLFCIGLIIYLGISIFEDDSYLYRVIVYKKDSSNRKPQPNNILEYVIYKLIIKKE